jgi:hypothetical protein
MRTSRPASGLARAASRAVTESVKSSSSASIERIHGCVAMSRAALRAAAKSSSQGNEETRAPWLRAIAADVSREPVSTTTIWETIPEREARQRGSDASSSRTIRQAEMG